MQKCLESWKQNNPSWDVIFLDGSSLKDHVNLNVPREKLTHLDENHQADLVRVCLLAQYGGVWVDATVFCVAPLDGWLHGCMDSGFFCFYKPGRDRIMSSWFLATEKAIPYLSG